MGYVSTGMGDRFSAVLVSLMALGLALVDQKPFWPCLLFFHQQYHCVIISFNEVCFLPETSVAQ